MNNTNQIAQRIAEYLEAKNISQRAFAKALNVQPSKICRQLSGESVLSADIINGFVSTYNDVNLSWLLLGIPPMLLPVPFDTPSQPQPVNYFVRSSAVADAPAQQPQPTPAPGVDNLAEALSVIKSQQQIIDRQAEMLANLLKQLNQ